MDKIFQDWENFYKERYKGWSGSEQFVGSGSRLERLVDEMCWPSDKIRGELRENFKAVFKDAYSEMLVSGPTSVWTLCPHHLLPCHFQVWIGYIPNGGVLGLSKFSRVAVTLGRRPIMQEQYTREVADAVEKHLEPKGVGVTVIGNHGCIGCRGVTQEVDVVTTVLRGYFLSEPEVKKEFYDMIRMSSDRT